MLSRSRVVTMKRRERSISVVARLLALSGLRTLTGDCQAKLNWFHIGFAKIPICEQALVFARGGLVAGAWSNTSRSLQVESPAFDFWFYTHRSVPQCRFTTPGRARRLLPLAMRLLALHRLALSWALCMRTIRLCKKFPRLKLFIEPWRVTAKMRRETKKGRLRLLKRRGSNDSQLGKH